MPRLRTPTWTFEPICIASASTHRSPTASIIPTWLPLALSTRPPFHRPFRNLDIDLGRKIVCDEARILRQIINEHRGGFLYEVNGAFVALLRDLGFKVTLLSARVTRDDETDGPEFDDRTLRVDRVSSRPTSADHESAQGGNGGRQVDWEIHIQPSSRTSFQTSSGCATITRPHPSRISHAREYAPSQLLKVARRCRMKC